MGDRGTIVTHHPHLQKQEKCICNTKIIEAKHWDSNDKIETETKEEGEVESKINTPFALFAFQCKLLCHLSLKYNVLVVPFSS